MNISFSIIYSTDVSKLPRYYSTMFWGASQAIFQIYLHLLANQFADPTPTDLGKD
jgi:hypothetical protein